MCYALAVVLMGVDIVALLGVMTGGRLDVVLLKETIKGYLVM